MSTDNPFNVLLVIDMSEVEYLGVDHPIHTADKTETIKECFEILVWLQTHYHLELPHIRRPVVKSSE